MLETTTTSPIWRNLGIDLLPKLLRKYLPFLKSRVHDERPKVAICNRRSTALTRCAVHILPTLLSLNFIILNFHGYYIGDELAGPSGSDGQKINALQFAAKLHELLINASVATMLLSYIRYELTFGKGLPFGILLGGFEFTSLSYLWSIDMWGGIISSKSYFSTIRRVLLAMIFFTATILASIANPASAIAMIPYSDFWKACGTRYWINASSDTLWPGQVDATTFDADRCLQNNLDVNFDCPAAGIQSIKMFAPSMQARGFDSVPVRNLVVHGGQSTRTMNVTSKIGRNTDDLTTAFVPPLALTNAFVKAGTWWPTAARFAFESNGSRFWLARQSRIETPALAPATRVQCSRLTSTGTDENRTIEFPLIDISSQTMIRSDYLESNIMKSLAEDDRLDIPQVKVTWHNLSNTAFGPSTTGAIVVLPSQAGSDNLTYTTCNIDARWAPSSLWTVDGKNVIGMPDGLPEITNPLGRYAGDWLWPKVQVDLDWLKNLNQDISSSRGGISAFAAIAADAGIDERNDATHPPVIETILAMMITDALARVGGNATLQGELKGRGELGPAGWKNGPWVEEYMEFGDAYDVDPPTLSDGDTWHNAKLLVYVNGHGYSLTGGTRKFACAVLLFHAALAVLHIAYSLKSGLSSSSWDTIAELVALAINSTPLEKLKNTCAGIESSNLMGQPTRILESKATDQHLEMVFHCCSEDKDSLSDLELDKTHERQPLKINKEYGGIS